MDNISVVNILHRFNHLPRNSTPVLFTRLMLRKIQLQVPVLLVVKIQVFAVTVDVPSNPLVPAEMNVYLLFDLECAKVDGIGFVLGLLAGDFVVDLMDDRELPDVEDST